MPQTPASASVLVGDIAGTAAAHQDAVAQELFGVNFTQTTSSVQNQLKLLSDDAFFELSNLAKWFNLIDASYTGPSDAAESAVANYFNELFRALWLSKAMRRWRSAEVGAQYFKEHAAPLFERIASFFDTADFGSSTGPGDVFSVASIARAAISILVRQRTPVIPPFSEASRTIRAQYVQMWEERRWTFRVRHKQVTIDSTSGNLKFPDNDPDVFDGLASKHIVISDTSGTGRRPRFDVAWLDSERFSQAAAYYRGVTSRPLYFFDEDIGSKTLIHWAPNPDVDYIAFANVLIKAPSFPDANANPSAGDAFDLLPVPLRSHLVDRVVAYLLSAWGREDVDAARWVQLVRDNADMFADNWVDRGAHRYTARGHHGLDYVKSRTSYRGRNIIGQIE